MTRFIPRLTHAYLDLIIGIAMTLTSLELGYTGNSGVCLIAAGVIVIGVTLMSRHELGICRWIPMGLHLFLDAILALSLLLVALLTKDFTTAVFGAILLGLSIWTESYVAFSLRGRRGDSCRPDHSRESRL